MTVIYQPDESDLIYTIQEAAVKLKIGKNLMYRIVRAELIPVLKLGNLKILHTDLIAFVGKHRGRDLSNPEYIKMIEWD